MLLIVLFSLFACCLWFLIRVSHEEYRGEIPFILSKRLNVFQHIGRLVSMMGNY